MKAVELIAAISAMPTWPLPSEYPHRPYGEVLAIFRLELEAWERDCLDVATTRTEET